MLLKDDLVQSHDSDEEDDDYVPPTKEESDSEASGAEDQETSAVAVKTKEDEESKKRAREALWADFQASVSAGSSNPSPHVAVKEKLVKVEKKYLFAGKEVIEVIEVPETSADAKKWPAWKDPATTIERTETSDALRTVTAAVDTNPTTTQVSNVDRKSADSPIATTSTDTNYVSSTVDKSIETTAQKPPLRKPGPRKSKVTLAPLPGPAKAKKLTTLDKSAMDWKIHIQAEQKAGSSVVDELEANRRGGGYLEKVEFLKRVDERREDNLDAMKSTKRRKL